MKGDIETYQELPTLFHCKITGDKNDTEVFIARGILAHEVYDGTGARAVGIRMLVKCGFTNICIMSGICGLSDDLAVGDLYLPLDHFNFNSANP